MRHIILTALMLAGALIATSTTASVLERMATHKTHYDTIGGKAVARD